MAMPLGSRPPLAPWARVSPTLWAWPWPQFVFLLVLVALGWGVLRLRRSRRARNEAALAAAVERGRHEALRVTTGVETSIDLTSPERTGVIDLNAGDSAHVDAGRGDGAEKRSR